MKYAMVIAVFCCASLSAMAQNGAAPPAPADSPAMKAVPKPAHAAVRGRRDTRLAPVVLPREFAPPQEAYASFPEEDAAAPAAPSACQAQLAKLAQFQPLPTLVGPGDCGASDAVRMDAITLSDQSKVAVTPPAILRCPMAKEVADWVRDDVAPSLKGLPPLRALDNLASYDCRGRNNVRAAKVSEHGRADALDVRGFQLADGRVLVLTDMNVDRDWREQIRSTVCARFATVLGPGSDGYHEEHVHLDLEERRNDYKICEWDVRVPPVVQAQAQAQPEAPDKVPDAAAGGGVALQGLDAPGALDDVPLPRPRPVAQIERSLRRQKF